MNGGSGSTIQSGPFILKKQLIKHEHLMEVLLEWVLSRVLVQCIDNSQFSVVLLIQATYKRKSLNIVHVIQK